MSYQDRDYEIVDYEVYRPASPDWELRGPPPSSLEPGQYFACVGAAQTYGCFCADPWPAIVARQIGLPALNFGVAGAGPSFFLQESWLEHLRNARFVVLQVMSGRSASNSLFETESGGEQLRRRSDGATLGAEAAWAELLHGDLDRFGDGVLRKIANRVLAVCGRRRVRELVAETRADWMRSSLRLLEAIPVPVVLPWFAKRRPDYRVEYRNLSTMLGEFPHLIDRAMVESLRPRAEVYVECVTSRGSPQPLVSRFTGMPITIDPAAARADLKGEAWAANSYYPSPEMHEDAAAALYEACLRLVGEERAGD